MGLGSIGIPSMILILVIALIVFGPKKLPEIGSAFGQTLREFKKSTSDLMNDDDDDSTDTEKESESEGESKSKSESKEEEL